MLNPKFITLIFFFVFLSFWTEGQNIYNNWYFGRHVGVTFNTNPPTSLIGGQTDQLEGVASISDNTGNLLFYTDGVSVWDKNHNIMPNGTGLTGSWTTSQSAVIVPLPSSITKYYIFTLGATLWSNGNLDYSIVDMALNSGNGDIIPSQKNISLTSNLTEKLATAVSTQCGVWLLTHQRNNNRFEARLVSGTGISSPVFSDIGSLHSSNPEPPYNFNGETGTMKVSKNNQRVGVANLQRVIEVFDFNPSTGILSNPITLPMSLPNDAYGVCFSPDNLRFYITEGVIAGNNYKIYQYDLSSNNQTTIINSKQFVGEVNTPIIHVADLQIGPNGKIYFAEPEVNYIGAIPNPNLIAPACGFNLNEILLTSGLSLSGLPSEIRTSSGSAIQFSFGNDTTLCPGTTLNLTAPIASTYLWSTGATTQTITVTTTGQYWVSVSNGTCFSSDTINVTFSLPTINLGDDTTLCTGQSLLLNGGVANTYLWSTGATSQTINVTSAGQYWIKASNSNCSKRDTIGVIYKFPPVFLFPPDTTLCNNQILKLNAGSATKYLWSTGETTQVINVTQSGNYSVNINYYSTCQKQFFITVKFESCDCLLFMPNAFTPNSDGLNDIFKPAKKSGCQFLFFSIFNRYGEKIYESTDLNKGWDGKYKGLQQDNGVFVWMITAIKDGQTKVFKGTVTLIR